MNWSCYSNYFLLYISNMQRKQDKPRTQNYTAKAWKMAEENLLKKKELTA